jgi:FixJ family two-component response regulator
MRNGAKSTVVEVAKEDSESLLVAVVDDDESVRTALVTAFESVGLHAASFASAEEFLSFARLEHVGCLITDLKMPGMSGLELQAEAAKRRRPIPTIIMTAYGEPEIRERAIRAGAVSFIAKPFDDNLLLETVRKILKP